MQNINIQKKYLLLMPPEEEFPEQFNSYMFLIMEILSIARRTKRVFVLPHIHSHPRNSMLCEAGETDHEKMVYGKISYPMELFFDIKRLNEYVETVSLDEFAKISNQTISVLCNFSKSEKDYRNVYGKNFTIRKCLEIDTVANIEKLEESYVAIAGYKRGKFLAKHTVNWHDDKNLDYWDIRKHLIYNKNLVDEAQRFIENNLNGKYLAVHWRRGDRCHPEMGASSEDMIDDPKEMRSRLQHYLIKPIQKIIEKYGITHIFLATNSGTQWHIDYLKEYLPIVQYSYSGIWQKMEFESVIEQIICVNSFYYFSSPTSYTKCSSFSRWIIDQRIIDNSQKRISYQKKMREIKQNILQKLLFRIWHSVKILLYRNKTSPPVSRKLDLSEVTEGILFDKNKVKIIAKSAIVGGSWETKPDKSIVSWDDKTIALFNKQAKKYENPVVFDIGANTGSFSLLPKYNPTMTVYAFEPQPNISEILEKNIKLNSLEEKVSVYRSVLSDKKGMVEFHIPSDNSQSGLATMGIPKRFSDSKTISVPSTTLDSFVEENDIKNISLIKIDTEGSELFVLKGGEKSIRKYMPDMLIEYNPENVRQFGYDPKDTLHLLTSWGYNISFVDYEDILCVKDIKNNNKL